ncbi:hypothetical protein QV01_09270 [Gallibacterium genomosp. 3]|uniref:Uncharacterized protein n=1 Tax=Gallibacterium genomosp. 3 TaxID=505345 RepID=A0A1A7NMY2_9PAST|nr:hypothetical protein [Gallibacterium genomosp. 3]OBW90970.1 hypothetical protein QV01_09270 [Gallibacterium genomosp. 3]
MNRISLTKYDGIEKFTLLDAWNFFKFSKGYSSDIAMLLLFENVIDAYSGISNIGIYGQERNSYRFEVTNDLTGEWENIRSIYKWYRNPDNKNSYSLDYKLEEDDLLTMEKYFFDKYEFMKFFDIPINETKKVENSYLINNEGITPIEQQLNNTNEARIDLDTLAHFIDLLLEASPELRRKDGKKPTYSELHTILSHKFPNERIPSKGTLKKYMGDL